MNFFDRVKQQLSFNSQEDSIKKGSIVAGPLGSALYRPSPVKYVRSDLSQNLRNTWGDNAKKTVGAAKFALGTAIKAKNYLTGLGAPSANATSTRQPSPTAMPTPTATPTPTRIPMTTQRVEPYPIGPGTPNRNELYPKLRAREAVIQPKTFDAIIKGPGTDYDKRMKLALAYQESTGGLKPEGDKDEYGVPQSFGDYHIQPMNAPPVEGYDKPTEAQARDSEWASKYLSDFLDYNELGVTPERRMLRWNSNSGYQKDKKLRRKDGTLYEKNEGPRYDVDIPRAATMSAFIRGK